MKKYSLEIIAEHYYTDLAALMNSAAATNKKGSQINFYKGIETASRLFLSRTKSGNKLIFIGNGASAAMASHLSADFWKNAGVKAIAFNDIALLTAVSNDCGYQHVFEKPMKVFADRGDVVVAISSSGKSENILNAVKAARSKHCSIITLSGFMEGNPLRKLGDINFYVHSGFYGPVEIIHHSICHCILDTILTARAKTGRK
ncbi:SIS domain-containing protein [Patescibacteria group bacterium]|nr:SIS domain-containing protein [Patescibacteria group bacterium]